MPLGKQLQQHLKMQGTSRYLLVCLFVFEELLLFQTAINHSSFFHLKLVYPGRIVCNFVIRALNCRAGGFGFNPKGYTNTQGLKKSEK